MTKIPIERPPFPPPPPELDKFGNPIQPEPPPPPPAPKRTPAWVKLPDGHDRSTLLPPWPDRMVREPIKAAALTWVERLSLPIRHKRALLTSWGEYTGVTLTGDDYAYLTDFQAPPGRS